MIRQRTIILALSVLTVVAGCTGDPDAADAEHLAEVAERGAQVMPFDLERTMHVFVNREDGGLQKVVARDTTDREQIDLIRDHLQEEAERFESGDFSDPARIHGHDMPGLHTLVQNAERLEVEYTPLPEGAQIRYTTQNAELVRAIHDWFAAQRSDHGGHARGH